MANNKSGPGLLDIAPPEIVTKRFEIRGGAVEVRGIKNREWAILQRRFPELNKLMETSEEERARMTEENLALNANGIVAAIIAAGLGACGDENIEELINDRLLENEQIMVFGAIMELTAEQNKEELRKTEAKIGPLANGGGKTKSASTNNSPQLSLL